LCLVYTRTMDTQEITYFHTQSIVKLEDNAKHDVGKLEAFQDDFRVGLMHWDMVTGECLTVFTHQGYRRQGIATRMWSYAREIYGVEHSRERTVDGQAWALSLGEILPPWSRV